MAPHGHADEQNQAENRSDGKPDDFAGLHDFLLMFGAHQPLRAARQVNDLAGVIMVYRAYQVKYRMPVISIGDRYRGA
jgi:hypothetical protein